MHPDIQTSNIEKLRALVSQLKYKDGWRFYLNQISPSGAYLLIDVATQNSLRPGLTINICHHLAIPDIAFAELDEGRWERWLLDQIIKVETHEACEFFEINGERPYFPDHSALGNPYRIERKGEQSVAAG
jgi:hypothetical protein